ncbi:NAD-P-binding protein [Fomitopsis serialis]|uniref:NAD-P-binding protein n=1 Tax=Fomitopsis serialis TaxID=139415 RepID=UPI002007B49D|nr:NAD-P-binding protein [Neoantrodia serialis]KAH9917300.1 NAD-P-binding protein [Neoantrodia serialis]
MSHHQVWFITGSSSGLGRTMTEHVLDKGDIVVATLRSPELDVSNAQEIKNAFAAAVERFGRIDAVFNNAAYCILGEAERAMFDVNLWGAINVSKEAVRVFREVNKPAGGRLLQISSVAGIVGVPGIAYYCAAKSGLNAFSEALSREVDPDWNIKIVIVEPGALRTPALRKTVRIPSHPAYLNNKAMLAQREAHSVDDWPWMADTAKAADILHRIAASPDPPLYLPLGTDAVDFARAKYPQMVEATDAVVGLSEELRVEMTDVPAISAGAMRLG